MASGCFIFFAEGDVRERERKSFWVLHFCRKGGCEREREKERERPSGCFIFVADSEGDVREREKEREGGSGTVAQRLVCVMMLYWRKVHKQ